MEDENVFISIVRFLNNSILFILFILFLSGLVLEKELFFNTEFSIILIGIIIYFLMVNLLKKLLFNKYKKLFSDSTEIGDLDFKICSKKVISFFVFLSILFGIYSFSNFTYSYEINNKHNYYIDITYKEIKSYISSNSYYANSYLKVNNMIEYENALKNLENAYPLFENIKLFKKTQIERSDFSYYLFFLIVSIYFILNAIFCIQLHPKYVLGGELSSFICNKNGGIAGVDI